MPLLTGNVCLSASYGDGVFSCSAERTGEMYFNQVEFGQRIKEQRNRMGLTQEELALRLNIGHIHMNSIECGRKGCSIDLILELSELFNVSTDYLLKGQINTNVETKELLLEMRDNLELLLSKMGEK